MIELFLILLGWWYIGCFGFIFWWTSEFDFTADELLTCLLVGFLGPISFIVGALNHTRLGTKVLIKSKRK